MEPKVWPEVKLTYPPALREAYYAGTLFGEWFAKYPPWSPARTEGRYLFCDRMLSSRQIPHSGRPIKQTSFFHEFFTGIQYLEAGYEALVYHREVEDVVCNQKACELFGGGVRPDGRTDAGEFIIPNSERGGRAPDLIVFHRETNRFRFVECKGKNERFTKSQILRFKGIEEFLNQSSSSQKEVLCDPSRPDLFPQLSVGRWIHVARLERAP